MNETGHDRDKLDALLRHAMQNAHVPQPPSDFAQTIARHAADVPEEARVESWLLRGLVAIGAVAAGAFCVPFIDAAGERVLQLLHGAPWPLLLAAGSVFAAMKLSELAQSPRMPGL